MQKKVAKKCIAAVMLLDGSCGVRLFDRWQFPTMTLISDELPLIVTGICCTPETTHYKCRFDAYYAVTIC